MTFDGQTYSLDIFLERLRRDLPTIAEATAATRRPADRRKLALGLIDVLTRFRGGMYERYGENYVPRLRARTDPAYLLPHQIFPDAAPALQNRLLVTMELLASWHYREVAPEVLIEEINTAAELLLEASVNRRAKRLSFQQLVDAAHSREFLRSYPRLEREDVRREFDAFPRDDSGSVDKWLNDRGRDVLVSLKDMRKNAKHRGRSGAEEWLDEHFWEVVSVLEHLAPHAKAHPSAGSGA